jgi:hypothetical protein
MDELPRALHPYSVAGFVDIHGGVIRDALIAACHEQQCLRSCISERACQFSALPQAPAAISAALRRQQYLGIVDYLLTIVGSLDIHGRGGRIQATGRRVQIFNRTRPYIKCEL